MAACSKTADELRKHLADSNFGADEALFFEFFSSHPSFPLCRLCGRSIAAHDLNAPLFADFSRPPATEPVVGQPVVVHQPDDSHIVQESAVAQDPGWSGMEKCSVIFAWVVSLYLWIHIVIFIPMCESNKDRNSIGLCNNYYGDRNSSGGEYRYNPVFYVVLAIVYIAYLIQALVSPTRQYLSNMLPMKAREYVRKIWDAKPNCWFSIQCYHYETRTRTVRDSKGNTRTETYRQRVNTHYATATFNFDTFQTVGDAVTLPANVKVTRMRLDKELSFADQYTSDRYESEFALFVQMNDRDTHKDTSRGFDLDGFHDYVLAFDDPAHPPPGFSLGGYLLCTFLTLSVPYRHFVLASSVPVDWKVLKQIGCAASSQQQQQQPIMFPAQPQGQQPPALYQPAHQGQPIPRNNNNNFHLRCEAVV